MVHKRFPLAAQIAVSVALAIVAGLTFGEHLLPFGDLGAAVVKVLKLLATPLVFFAVVDAFLRTRIPLSQGGRLIAISAANAVVATCLGLGVAHLIQGGVHWRAHVDELSGAAAAPASLPHTAWIDAIPKHILEPFMGSSIVPVMLLAVCIGLAAREVKTQAFGDLVTAMLDVWSKLLSWVIAFIPIAVFFIVGAVVAKSGAGVFKMLGWFLATIVAGMVVHVLVYYPVLLAVAAKRSPLRFFRDAADSILTALSAGSSLASLPVTLRCLEHKHKVGPDSARLAAIVGTNLNHDGIILYEAAAAIFITQAMGYDLTLAQQLTIAFASIMAGVGIAGVPEAGLITLPLVLSAAGIPDTMVVRLIPLLFSVDWLIGRLRAATNVTSDMVVAVILERHKPQSVEAPAAHP